MKTRAATYLFAISTLLLAGSVVQAFGQEQERIVPAFNIDIAGGPGFGRLSRYSFGGSATAGVLTAKTVYLAAGSGFRFIECMNTRHIIVPAFIRLKAYFLEPDNIGFFFTGDLGYSFDLSTSKGGSGASCSGRADSGCSLRGLYAEPQIGFDAVALNQILCFAMGLGIRRNRYLDYWDADTVFAKKAIALSLEFHLGVQF